MWYEGIEFGEEKLFVSGVEFLIDLDNFSFLNIVKYKKVGTD